MKKHRFSIQGEIYLKAIMAGEKLYEGRIYDPQKQRLQPGDLLELYEPQLKWGILCRVCSLDLYPSFQAMLEDKGIHTLLPQLKNSPKSPEELLAEGVSIYRAFPGSDREQALGVLAIGVTFLKCI